MMLVLGRVDIAAHAVGRKRRRHELHRTPGAGRTVTGHAAEVRLDQVDRGEVAPADTEATSASR